jgi:hypothetical protein
MCDRLSSFFGQPEFTAQQRLRGGRSQANDDLRLKQLNLSFQPWPARVGFGCAGLLVDPPFPAFFEPEMLDGIRDVDVGAIDTGILQSPV